MCEAVELVTSKIWYVKPQVGGSSPSVVSSDERKQRSSVGRAGLI